MAMAKIIMSTIIMPIINIPKVVKPRNLIIPIAFIIPFLVFKLTSKHICHMLALCAYAVTFDEQHALKYAAAT
jgi:hypothetical protein